MGRHADLGVGIAGRGYRAQTGHEGQRFAGDRDRVPAQLPDREPALVARRRRRADEPLVDTPVAARVLHRRADAIKPGALVRRLRRRERRARELLGIEAVIHLLGRVHAERQGAGQRLGLEAVAEAGHVGGLDGAAAQRRAAALEGGDVLDGHGRSPGWGVALEGSGIATGWPLRVYKRCPKGDPPWDRSRTTPRRPRSRTRTRWGPTASSSSSSAIRIRRRSTACSRSWASRRWRSTARRT